MNYINVLVSLHRGYGLGDAVQMSAVLRYVAAARPEWVISYQAEKGYHCVGRGIVAETFAYGEPYPHRWYDAEVQILLYDTFFGWHDRPSTHVSLVLDKHFDLPWLPEYGRYQVSVDEASAVAARTLLYRQRGDTRRCVAVHYQGDSAATKKNLTHEQADRICQAIERLGRRPVIMDWRGRSDLSYQKLRTPEAWGWDAEMVCAVIAECDAFVGIDSGPAKCAGATNVPTLVVWTGHHPAAHYDPSPNVTHLVPVGYHNLDPVCSDPAVVAFFEANYTVRLYDRDPVVEAEQWLREVLK